MVGGHPEAGHVDGLVGELVGPLGRGEDDGGGPVGLGAAVEQPQRAAHHGRGQDLVDGDLVLEVGVGVEAAVVVVLHRHRGQHLGGGAELVHVPGGEGGEEHGGRLAPVVERVAGGGPGQQALLGRLVAHLLHADDEHDVVHAARHHHGPDPEGVGSRWDRRSPPGCRGCRTGRGRSARCCRRCPPGPTGVPRWVATMAASTAGGRDPCRRWPGRRRRRRPPSARSSARRARRT